MVSMWATHFSSLFSHCNVIVIPHNKLANIFNLGQYSISTKKEKYFPPLISHPFFGQSFCSGSLDNSWGKWETDADLFLATKLSGQSAILATCAFWQTTISSKHFHYQREAIIITIMVCRFPHCFIHCCLDLFMLVSLFPTKVCDGRAFSMVCHFPLFLMMLLIKHSDGASFTTELSGDAPFLLFCTIFHTASPPI